MSWTVVRRVAAVGAAVVLSAGAGCSTGGDDESLIVDDGGAAAELARVVERTRDSSGRIEATFGADGDGGGEGALSIEFDGSSWRTTSTMVGMSGVGSTSDLVTLRIDGRTYTSAVESAFQVGDETGAMRTVPGLEHVEWIDLTDGEGGAVGAVDAVTGAADDPFGLIGRFTDVRESGTERLDGVPLRRFEATMSGEELLRSLPPEQQAERAEQARSAPRLTAIQEYRAAHMNVRATILLTEDGVLRRAEIETEVSGIEPEFQDCSMVTSPTLTREVYDYSELGRPVEITPPDPATVMSMDQVQQLQQEAVGGGSVLTFLDEQQDLPKGMAEGCPR